MRKLMAYIQLPITWLALYGIGIALMFMGLVLAKDSFSIFGFISPDWILTTAVIACLASCVAAMFAFSVMKSLSANSSLTTGYVVIAVFSLLWIASSVFGAYVDHSPNLFHKIAALFTSQVGTFIAYVLYSEQSDQAQE